MGTCPDTRVWFPGYDSLGVVSCISELDSEISVEERSGKKDTVRICWFRSSLYTTNISLDLSQLARAASRGPIIAISSIAGLRLSRRHHPRAARDTVRAHRLYAYIIPHYKEINKR